MSIDSSRLTELVWVFNEMVAAPLELTIGTYLLWQQLGIATLAGIVIMLLLIPINYVIVGRFKVIQDAIMKCKDIRTKLINEVLNGIRVLKLYAWEKSFMDQINEKRNDEIKQFKLKVYVESTLEFFLSTSTIMVS
jgi:ABC-type bacteriocin/lantibiotic exporter with double-glycine peptidase domain